ncbi:MalM family protein [Vibrio bivalvicida]|uniref:Transcriptional regulator n=1 Tax=Vibrio bivalvicida TaxID=1276888 RepID=A0A177XXP0_9VIBR|nr:MalM family protein [Vibrio bivalvicida]OAJ93369.1 transcriptional regulator [Vibrio bivalvicida]
MKFHALILSGCVALAGCQTTQPTEYVQAAQAEKVTTVSELQSVAMRLPSSVTVNVNSSSQYLNFNDIDSPVAVFELPANRGEFEVAITSHIEKTAFVPRAIIVDKAGNILESYDKDTFVYTKPRLNLGNRLVAEHDFFPPVGLDSVYLIVYTDKSEIGGFTDVIHPARLDAEGRGNYLPEVKDIPVPNGDTGKIEVSIDRVSLFSIGRPTTDDMPLKPSEAPAVEIVQPETQTYYHNAIRSAVESNNLDKALSLLEEAKALNVEGAQQVFIKAVNAK